ncbi:unnamed protein product [Arctogadus glacialis]
MHPSDGQLCSFCVCRALAAVLLHITEAFHSADRGSNVFFKPISHFDPLGDVFQRKTPLSCLLAWEACVCL